MSNKFNIVKQYYDAKLWNISRVKNAVLKGWITSNEYELITGEVFEE